MSVSRGGPYGSAKAGGAVPTGTLTIESTVKIWRLPSERTTMTRAPVVSVDSLPKIIGCPGYPAGPSVTASPGAPGTEPYWYQPAFQELIGTFMTPERSTPTASTARWTFRSGMRICTGGAVGNCTCAVGASATECDEDTCAGRPRRRPFSGTDVNEVAGSNEKT